MSEEKTMPGVFPEKIGKLSTNMLAYQRSLEIGEGLFYGVNYENAITVKSDESWMKTVFTDATYVEVREKGVRGQSSHAKATNKDLKPGGSNPQIVDVAHLPDETNGLLVVFDMKILGNAKSPSATDNSVVAKSLEDFVAKYGELGGFKELASRYFENIINARFMWRNHGLCEEGRVGIEMRVGSEKRFVMSDPYEMDLDEMMGVDNIIGALVEGTLEDVNWMIDGIAKGLEGTDVVVCRVVFCGKLFDGAEVYPSQEYIREDQKASKSKHLSFVRRMVNDRFVRVATFHNQKIGAALRCIDDWHGDEEFDFPVPVNPYAGVQELNVSLRDPSDKKDFYSIRRKPEEMWKTMIEGNIPDDAHFLVANLVRGGVFGEKP